MVALSPKRRRAERDRDAYESEEYAYDMRTTLPYAI